MWLTCLAVCLICVYQVNSSQIKRNETDTWLPTPNRRLTLDEYRQQRQNLIDEELSYGFESDIQLNENEIAANKIIMQLKKQEVDKGHIKQKDFKPSRHIFEVLDSLQNSSLFQIIRRMPKGGILHAHESAIYSTDVLVQLTYFPDLWQCDEDNQIVSFKFARSMPTDSINISCVWRTVAEAREQQGADVYNKKIKLLFTIFDRNVVKHPQIHFVDHFDAWARFVKIFRLVSPLVQCQPAFRFIMKNMLKEIFTDGVQYIELRMLFFDLYDSEGKVYGPETTLQIIHEVTEEFKAENPDFIDVKLIFTGRKRHIDDVEQYFSVIQELHRSFPNFLVGLDLAGNEERSPRLHHFAEALLLLPNDIKFFFHAGETNWYGSVDENLIDAIVLGTKRIGHGLALVKHPKLMEYVKEHEIAIEVNPISNQVLKLVDDFRNHPASTFLARNMAVVISSDDPLLWDVTPLTHDFYIAFIGIASVTSDLRTLKKFAVNSIKYSAMNDTEKPIAMAKWQSKWDEFIEQINADYSL